MPSNIIPFDNYKKIYIFLTIAVASEILLLLPVFIGTSLLSCAMYCVSIALPVFFILLAMQNILLGTFILILLIPFLNMAAKKLALSAGPIALTPMSCFIWSLFAIFFFGTVIKNENTEKFSCPHIDGVLILLVIFAFLSILSSYYIGTPLSRSSTVYVTAVIEPVLFYFLLRNALTSESKIKWLLFSIVLSMCIGCVVGFYFMQSIRGNLSLFLSTRGGSLGFGFRGINLYGVAAVLVFPLTFLFAVNSENKIQRIISVGVMFMMFISAITSFTRGLQIALAIEILILLLFYRSGRKYIYPIPGLISIAFLAFRQQLLILFMRFSEPGPNVLISSAGARLEAWIVSLKVFKIYPFGLGGGNFDYAWEQFKPLHIIPMGASHNIFLSVGTEFGVLTMIIFIILFFLQFRMCWWIFKNSKNKLHRNIAFIITVSLIGYCVYGMTTGVELSHIIRYYPVTTMNSFTIILFTLFAVITTLFVEERKKLLCSKNPKNLYPM